MSRRFAGPLVRFGGRRPVLALGAALVLVAGGLVVTVVTPALADTCLPNPVVCENAKTGNPASEWDIQGPGDDSIQGFSTDISVNVGGAISFKIKTDARAYTIDIYRLGYYGGMGARKVASVTPSASLPQTQPACVQDTTTWNYDCGTWAVSASWTVPTTAVSGVYIAKLTRTDTGGASQITFVVRDDSSTSAVYFKTADATWQAYNRYGGEDFYTGQNNGRSYEVSYNRPFATRGDNNGRSFLFSNEYPMIRFLERNGYDVSYTTDVDADRHGTLLKNHKTFMSVGHDEYWSYPERANVEAARDAGVNLAFFSGNEVYWRTYFANSKDGSNTAYRTEVAYKETWSNGHIDQTSNQWTGTYRDPRYLNQTLPNGQKLIGGGTPENSLTGTMYMANDDDLALQVPAAQGKDRIWRNTTVATQAAGATATLAPHTVGYESDEDVDNGFRPAGLIDMSTTTGSTPEELIDFGNTAPPGTTTHHITLYKAASGALVFSAGTIQWAWALDATHDGTAVTPNVPMQQATINILADMGVQPATLMSGLVSATKSTDTAAPTATIVAPASATNGASVTINGTASDTGGGVVAGVEVSTDGGTSWHPASGTTSWSYSFYATGTTSQSIRVRGVDDSANQGAASVATIALSGSASLFGTRVPTLTDTDTTPVELGVKFTPSVDGTITGVKFYKAATNTGTHTGSLWSATGDLLATGTFGSAANGSGVGWQTLTFSTPVAVTHGTTYVASYYTPTGHASYAQWAFSYAPWVSGPLTAGRSSDVGGNGTYHQGPGFPDQTYADTNYYVDPLFTLAVARPQVTSTTPAANATGVATTVAPSAVFSTAMTASSITFTLANGSTPVTGTTAYNATTRTVTFTPSAALAAGKTYTATVNGNDSGGTAMAAPYSWSFATLASGGSQTYTIFPSTATPANPSWNDPNPNELGVKFSSDVDGVVTGVRFYKGSTNTGTHTGSLWTASGTLLATATFTGESATGWQTVTFSTPVAISAGATYIASYHTNAGNYAVDLNALASGVNNAPLHVPANGAVYRYGSGGSVPTNAIPHNLWVDVLFSAQATAPTVTGATPAANATGVVATVKPTATFSKSMNPSTLVFTVKQGSTTVPGTVAYDDPSKTATFTPSAALSPSTVYSVSVAGSDTGGTAMAAAYTWSFTTASGSLGAAVTIWPDTATPANVNWNDPNPNSLGVKFTSDVAGVVSGVRFYKGPLNTGVHTGSLWTASGTLLATATFTNETASGWQSVTFSNPVAITAGTQYVVSYTTTTGYYAVDAGGLSSNVDHAPLHALANGGMYNYSGGFPSNATTLNLWVDVIFQPSS